MVGKGGSLAALLVLVLVPLLLLVEPASSHYPQATSSLELEAGAAGAASATPVTSILSRKTRSYLCPWRP